MCISIHAPRAGSDFTPRITSHWRRVFQSTLPVRGATLPTLDYQPSAGISIHAPRAGSDAKMDENAVKEEKYFNPRSPCGERLFCCALWRVCFIFQSTLPVRGATRRAVKGDPGGAISIHAPRAGSDSLTPNMETAGVYFNPRSPCGERRRYKAGDGEGRHFNPRSPCGERLFLLLGIKSLC